jgi:hypothetical protein
VFLQKLDSLQRSQSSAARQGGNKRANRIRLLKHIMQELAADTFELNQLKRGQVLEADVSSKPIPSESQTGRQAHRSHVPRSPSHQGGGNRSCGGF